MLSSIFMILTHFSAVPGLEWSQLSELSLFLPFDAYMPQGPPINWRSKMGGRDRDGTPVSGTAPPSDTITAFWSSFLALSFLPG